MLDRIEGSFAGDHDAKTKIGAAVRYLLRDLRGGAHDDAVREIIDIVQGVANEPSSRQDVPDTAARPTPMGSVSYKSYVIDAYRREEDRWRSTIRRQDGKKIRIASPPAVVDHATTGSDALTAEKAVEFAKRTIDAGGVM